jgi:hypothetical protein
MQWSEQITDSAVKAACTRELDEDAQLVSDQDIKLVC